TARPWICRSRSTRLTCRRRSTWRTTRTRASSAFACSMPSSSRRAEGALTLLAIAALAVVVRVPFLLYGERFFDSDQAVEGLMARHLLQGEFPIFLWGQHYKGVPEVYLAAPVFWLFGSSVVALEAATLVCFGVFVGLQFRRCERLFSTRIAWMATALVLSGPPTLVLWTLSGNAEVVF